MRELARAAALIGLIDRDVESSEARRMARGREAAGVASSAKIATLVNSPTP